MPTNDERREVAARLRELADENTVTATDYLVREIFKELGVEPPTPTSNPTLRDLEAYDQAFIYRLADLIEPLPERTCRVELIDTGNEAAYEHYEHIAHCHSCHHEFGYVLYNEDGDTWQDEKPNYCPNCGAKVIEQRKEARCQTEMTGS